MLGVAASGLVIASMMLVPATALAGPGSPPDPHPDTITTVEEVPATGNLLANDLNPGEGTLTVVAPFPTLSASVGTLVVAANGDYTFTPAANFSGSASTSYNVANDKHTRSAAINIVVTPAQDPPVANDDTVTVTEDTATNVTAAIKGNDTDGDGDALTVTGVSNASGGSVELNAGVVTFTPDADLCGAGAGSFDYDISDGNGGSDTGHVTVDITCVNDDPHAVNDSASGTEDTDLVIAGADLVANDTDTEGDSLSVSGVSNASGGSVDLSGGDVTFTPDADLCGNNVASFDYTVSDGNGGSDTGHVTIGLSCDPDAPVANDDTVTVDEDSSNTDVTGDLLANDTDGDGDSLTVTSVDNATGGSVDLTAGAVTFTPDADLCGDGAAGFDYTVDDGNGGTDTGHVTIDLSCENDNPVATDDSASGTEDTDVVIQGDDLTANDTDIDGDALSVSAVSNPTGGTVDLTAGVVTFTPDADLCGDGAAGFDYTVDDGNGGTDTGHVTIDLSCENDNPVATDDSASGTEDTDVVIQGDDLTANDTDIDGDALSVSAVSNPTGGTVDLTAGVVTFTPDADLCGDGAAGFDYTVDDGNGGTETGHVTIDLECVDDAPVAVDDVATEVEGNFVIIDAATLAANDTDTEGDSLTVTGVSNPTGGSVSLDAGTITFVPNDDLCGDGAAGFDYTVSDGTDSDTGHVTIDITCVNDDPFAVDDTIMVDENSADNDVTAAILANDSDIEHDALTVSSVFNATGGTVNLAAGVVTFTPDADLCGNGEASFEYAISDGNGGTDSAHVTVDINCVGNVAPVAVDDAVTGTEDTDLVIDTADLVGNDVDTDPLTVTAVDGATGGTAVLNNDDTVTFTPDADLCGDDAAGFDYTVDDGNGGSDTGHVTIDLTCINDGPVGVDDTATIAQGSGPADYDVLANDTDTENDPLSLKLPLGVSPVAAGVASIHLGELQFTPANNFHGTVVITYTLTDGDKDDTATLTITVTAETTPPVAMAPGVAFWKGRVDQTVPLRVTWSASDNLSGIASYQLQVSVAGGPFTTIYTGPATSHTKFYPLRKTMTWRVRATDGAGNVSAWASSRRRINTVQNSNHHMVYTGNWKGVAEPKASGAGYIYTQGLGNKAKTTFTGRAVLYVATKLKSGGHVKVIVDGHLVGTYSLHAKKTRFGRIISRATWAANGQHRIKIVALDNGKKATFDTFLIMK